MAKAPGSVQVSVPDRKLSRWGTLSATSSNANCSTNSIFLKRFRALHHYSIEADLREHEDRSMRANYILCLPAAGFPGGLTGQYLRGEIASQKKLGSKKQTPAENEVVGLDAYMIAVLVSVGATILSLCI
jgi:hypothetical protein